MKNKIYSALLSLLALTFLQGTLTGCSDDKEIIFDHELPQFDLRDDAILLEVIVPLGTTSDDRIFISGAFNGNDDEAVKTDARWELQQAPDCDAKWGIYLRPSDFVAGKTLADGYHFVSMNQGVERSLKNDTIIRTETYTTGSRTNVTVVRWKAYFDVPVDPGEVKHDGYVIYVVDNSGYDDLALYAWGDAEAFGGWPGVQKTGEIEIDGQKYKYFDTGEANKGIGLNLIFNNNNNGSQLGDYHVTLDKDYYLELTPDGVGEYVKHDGFSVFVYDKTTWGELNLYMWGAVNDLNGAWPGMQSTGTQTVKGVEYKYFDMGAANAGLAQNIIFNGGGKQLADYAYTIDRDVYLEITDSGVTEIDPATYNPSAEAEE